VVVSGLAYGVDSWAHRAAMDAGGKTVAVLASGLDVPLPRWQAELAAEIVERGGCLVSEQAPGMPALKHHFLLRNRIIAGLSLGTVVVEARDKSGALVTANYALEANRVVFAVPGDVDRETSVGPNRFIRQGAVLVRDAQDVLEELTGQIPTDLVSRIPQASGISTTELLTLLGDKPRTVEDVAGELGTSLPDALATLSQLELDGRVVRCVDGRFALKKT
jgi:DNA processing protein